MAAFAGPDADPAWSHGLRLGGGRDAAALRQAAVDAGLGWASLTAAEAERLPRSDG